MINKDKHYKEISGQISLAYYFLKRDDREPDINPILIRSISQLEELGFKNIIEVNGIAFKVNVYDNKKTISAKIK